MPIELKFHHGAISVPDLEASIRWYRDLLGFEVENRFEIPKARAKVAMITAERELRAKGADIVFVGRFKHLAPNLFMRATAAI